MLGCQVWGLNVIGLFCLEAMRFSFDFQGSEFSFNESSLTLDVQGLEQVGQSAKYLAAATCPRCGGHRYKFWAP